MMLVEASRSQKRHWLVLLPLAGILIGVYAFTYSGRIESGDTLALFNATASMVDYGDLLLDKSAADTPPNGDTIPSPYPLASVEVEPLQLLLSAPLYWLASQIPNVGLVHAVWFFNILVSTATVLVFYVYASTLGYSSLTAVAAALALGFGTLFWPYSRTFFREPLAGLFILLTALSVEQLRQQRYRSILFWALSAVMLIGAFLAKEAVVFALPGFIIILAPSVKVHKALIRFLVIVFAVIMGVLFISTFASSVISFTPVYDVIASVLRRTPQQAATMHRALHSYLLSIGGSVWGTSPILLLAVPGMVLLYRARNYRYPLALLSLLFSFLLGYAFLRGEHWFGGLSWPPRFLIPAVPILMVGTLPVWERIFWKPLRWGWVGCAVAVSVYSLWVQFSAVSYDWGTYINILPPEANKLLEWGGGLNEVRYLRWVLLPALWGSQPLDFAWVRVGIGEWPVICLFVVGLCAIWLAYLLTMRSLLASSRLIKFGQFILYPFALIVLIGLGLVSINRDVIYSGGNDSLRSTLSLLRANTTTGDVLVLANNEYETFFLNHGKLPLPRVISLPDAPGERPNEGQEPSVSSTNPDALLVKSSVPLLHSLSQYRSILWLLSDFGAWHPWAVRPAEQFMVSHYYPIRELAAEPPDPRIRLIEYSTIPAPDPFAFRGPDELSPFQFGEAISLLGFTLPNGHTYRAGDVLPISLYWRAEDTLEQNYTVAYFVATSSGEVAAQGVDSQPAWGLSPTSTWEAGIPEWDNRALRLPLSLTPGAYHIWLRLYQTNDNHLQLTVLGGDTAQDGTVAVLPVEIQIVE